MADVNPDLPAGFDDPASEWWVPPDLRPYYSRSEAADLRALGELPDVADVAGVAPSRFLADLGRYVRRRYALTGRAAYHHWLKSPDWAALRRLTYAMQRGRCYDCRCEVALHRDRSGRPVVDVHHLSYRRLGHELPFSDVVGLCRPCHDQRHG